MKIYGLALLIGTCVLAQDTTPPSDSSSLLSSWQTAGMFNGRFWRTLDTNRKATYLMGYRNAVEHVIYESNHDITIEEFSAAANHSWAYGLSFQEISRAMDKFYETPENGPISIPDAIFVISKRSQGAEEAELQKIVADMRARATTK